MPVLCVLYIYIYNSLEFRNRCIYREIDLYIVQAVLNNSLQL